MFASDSPTPPAAASTQVGGDPSQPGRLWRLPLPLPDPPTPAPSLYLPRQPRGGSQSERRRRHVTAQSWCQGARGERGAEPRGAAAGAQCERHPSQPHPRVRAVAVPIPDAVRPEALDLPARGVPGAGEPGLGFLAAALGTALGRVSPRALTLPSCAPLCAASACISLFLSFFFPFGESRTRRTGSGCSEGSFGLGKVLRSWGGGARGRGWRAGSWDRGTRWIGSPRAGLTCVVPGPQRSVPIGAPGAPRERPRWKEPGSGEAARLLLPLPPGLGAPAPRPRPPAAAQQTWSPASSAPGEKLGGDWD